MNNEWAQLRRRRGFTLVELLVVIAIISLMIAAMLPALAGSREAARRMQCSHQLGRIAAALQNYESSYARFPAGSWHESTPVLLRREGRQQAWTISLLPYWQRNDAYRLIDREQPLFAEANAPVRAVSIAALVCPTDFTRGFTSEKASSYAASAHDQEAPLAAELTGALAVNQPLRMEDFRDGLAHTLFIGEKRTDPADLGWMSGTRSTLRNTGHGLNTHFLASDEPAAAEDFVGGFGSNHHGGAWLGLGDGQVRFFSDQTDLQLLQRLANRADGQLIDDDEL